MDPPEETAEQVNQTLEEALEKEELEEAEKEDPQGVKELIPRDKQRRFKCWFVSLLITLGQYQHDYLNVVESQKCLYYVR